MQCELNRTIIKVILYIFSFSRKYDCSNLYNCNKDNFLDKSNFIDYSPMTGMHRVLLQCDYLERSKKSKRGRERHAIRSDRSRPIFGLRLSWPRVSALSGLAFAKRTNTRAAGSSAGAAKRKRLWEARGHACWPTRRDIGHTWTTPPLPVSAGSSSSLGENSRRESGNACVCRPITPS